MLLLRRCQYFRTRLARQRDDAPISCFRPASVAVVGATRPASSPSSLLRQSPLPSPSRRAIGGRYWSSSALANNYGAADMGKHERRIDNTISSSVARHPPRSTKPPQMMLGRAFGERWSSASSEHKLGPGAVYLDMDYCETIEEATNMSFTFVDDLSASDLASIWTRASQLMKQRSRKKKPENYDDYQLEKLTHRLNLMYSITMGGLEIFGPKDYPKQHLPLLELS